MYVPGRKVSKGQRFMVIVGTLIIIAGVGLTIWLLASIDVRLFFILPVCAGIVYLGYRWVKAGKA
jgi:hypothetical protein